MEFLRRGGVHIQVVAVNVHHREATERPESIYYKEPRFDPTGLLRKYMGP